MKVICLGGPYHGLEVELPAQQDVYRPTGELRPRYEKRLQSGSGSQAYFAFSELSELEANMLVMEHVRSIGTRAASARERHAQGAGGNGASPGVVGGTQARGA
jgi:hypothetical protein